MNGPKSSLKSVTRRISLVIGVAALISGVHYTACANQTIRELWDGTIGNNPVDGIRSNDLSTVGLDAGTTWVSSPPGNTSLRCDNWDLDWEIGGVQYTGTFLPPTFGTPGLFAYYGSDGNMDTTLTNAATGLPYGDYYSQCYATRALTTNAYINFRSNGTYYFSVRFFKSVSWWQGDNMGGIGFASSAAPNARFVGAGWTRLSTFLAQGGVTDISETDYITTGTLNQAGLASHPDDSGGPYLPMVAGATGLLAGQDAGILVGQLITTTTGDSEINIKVYLPSVTLDTDPTAIYWDTSYSFRETSVMTRLLVWEHGTGPGTLDAIRVGTSYGDVIGLETVGAPSANPSNTVYAGTTVTLTQNAGLNTGAFPMSFQWFSNSVSLQDATNSSLVLASPTTNFTATYSVVASNFYGALTSAIPVKVNPAVPPIITAQPVSVTRYLGSTTAAFTFGINGTPPFGFQWRHAGTNIPAALNPTATNQTLKLGPITLADAGNYSVRITNQFGSTNTDGVATLNEIVPAPQSYASAVTSLSPYGYWRLDDQGNTNGPAVVYDYWGWNNGVALDSADPDTTMLFGVPGASFIGFPTNHQATTINWNTWMHAHPSRLNLPVLPYYTNTMTFTMWVNGGGELMARNGYGNAYGLETSSAGSLQFDWGGVTSWDSGLVVPANTWTFVALVVEPSAETIYMGSGAIPLMTSGNYLQVSDSTTLGDTAGLTPLAVGRNPWPWAESGNGSPYATMSGTWSDVAVFYQSLTAEQITDLYLAGVGIWIKGTPDGAGNLNLTWIQGGTLQQASSVTGPYTDISDATQPYPVPITTATAQRFYRARK